MTTPIIFISYSHDDEIWKNRLEPFLKVLELHERIKTWDDRQIGVGTDGYKKIEQELKEATIAVCLISQHYLSSNFCVKEEISCILERRKHGGMAIIPILLRHCPWKAIPWLRGIQMFPRDEKPVRSLSSNNQDKVFTEVAYYILDVIDNPEHYRLAFPPPQWNVLPKEKIYIERLPATGAELFGRKSELELLDKAWESNTTNIISFVAWGGVGKSTLVNKWLESMATDNYRGAERVYGWSFFSQGTGERVTSSDLFIAHALKWFGESGPTIVSPWDKGQRLADLVRQEKTLLLLDGLEPLQSYYVSERGKIKDPALSVLLTELARRNHGLCIITTREWIADLKPFQRTVQQKDLEQISPEAGRALLRVGGVYGCDADLEKATGNFGNNALALTLLATYLHEIPGHDISNASYIPDINVPEKKGKHARRVMAVFANRFGEGPELDVLRILGLFDRPAEKRLVEALRAEPSIPNLTEHIQGIDEAKWMQLLEKLRGFKLIAKQSKHNPDTIDAHPLVREHFGDQLKQEFPDAWREGHNRLYQYLKRTAKEFPDKIEDMDKLYEAVVHGCQAGQYRDVLEVHWKRIAQKNKFYSTRFLGMVSENLAACSYFFDPDPPWSRLVDGLTEEDKGYVLDWAGFDLRRLGQLDYAIRFMKDSLDITVAIKDWSKASARASNLSEFLLLRGDIVEALEYAQQSVTHADKGTDPRIRIRSRTIQADVLHQLGQLEEADRIFGEAEGIQGSDSSHPLLHAFQGFLYCDLLLSRGEYRKAQHRATETSKYDNVNLWSDLAIALSLHLIPGVSHLLIALEEGANDFDEAAKHLDQAVNDLRDDRQQHHIPRGLLARAKLYRLQKEKDFDKAKKDIEEALSIARQGEMHLHETDCYLEYARLYLASDEKKKARQNLAKAKRMIKKMGYHRRDGEVEELETQL